jgi:hypothetical protein
MTDYQIHGGARRCAVSGRDLKPGERYFSLLLEEEGKFIRKDFSREAWPGAPAQAIGFWQGRVNDAKGPRRPPIDDEVLSDFFTRLEGQEEPGKVRFRYVLGLLLMRRKRLRFESSTQEDGREMLVLRCSRTGARFRVANPGLTDEEMEAVQEDVFQALGWE